MEKEKRYVAPFDMFNGEVKKGDIFINELDSNYIYFHKDRWTVAKEIVEAYFEEYIEPKKQITMDDIVVGKTVLISKDDEGLCIRKTNGKVLVGDMWWNILRINENFTIKE